MLTGVQIKPDSHISKTFLAKCIVSLQFWQFSSSFSDSSVYPFCRRLFEFLTTGHAG